MYRVIQFIDVSDGYPGMLVPVFSSTTTNLPYVQQMDEYFQVREMLPFLEYENYKLLISDGKRHVDVGDRGLIAFRSTDNSIFCGNTSEVIEHVEGLREKLKASVHLYSQLQRIEGEKLAGMYEHWRAVADASFEDKGQRAFWLNSEVSLLQAQSQIWDDIESSSHQEQSGKRIGLKGSASEYSSEYLIRWLSDRTNFIYSDWAKIWHYVNERHPFDPRLLEIAQQWLFVSQAEGGDLGESRSVLFALLHYARFSKNGLGELGEFLSDELSDNLPSIFYFVRPSQLFSNLLWFLGSYGNFDAMLKIAKFCTNRLPSEAYMVDSLIEGLRTSIARPSEDEIIIDEARSLLAVLLAERGTIHVDESGAPRS